jgi:hypothetical protein
MSFYVYEMTKKEISISMTFLGAPRQRINERRAMSFYVYEMTASA